MGVPCLGHQLVLGECVGTSVAVAHVAGLQAVWYDGSYIQETNAIPSFVAAGTDIVRAASITSSPSVPTNTVTGTTTAFFMQWTQGTYTVTLAAEMTMSVFMIGGGGGAGQDHIGGGGAGAFFQTNGLVFPAGTYTFTVGGGGVGEPGTNSATLEPFPGGDTFIRRDGNDFLRVRGGARGSTWETQSGSALNGGCGAGKLEQ